MIYGGTSGVRRIFRIDWSGSTGGTGFPSDTVGIFFGCALKNLIGGLALRFCLLRNMECRKKYNKIKNSPNKLNQTETELSGRKCRCTRSFELVQVVEYHHYAAWWKSTPSPFTTAQVKIYVKTLKNISVRNINIFWDSRDKINLRRPTMSKNELSAQRRSCIVLMCSI